MELPFDPTIPLLWLYPKSPETPIQKNLCTPIFIATQFTIAKYWKQPKFPSANEWIKKLWYSYTMEFYAAERKKEVIPFEQHGGTGEHYAKWNKPGSEGQIPYDLTFNWNIIHKRKKQKNITIDIEVKNNLTIARGEEGGDSGEKGFQELL